MASRDFRRRTVTAAALYGGTAAGILGTLIAARVLGPDQFGLLTLALAAAGFVQLLLDTTVEEAIVKYGIRYAATDDWGRLRGLFRVGIAIKWGGGAAATLVILALVPFADALFDEPELTAPLIVAAFIPIAQAPEGIAGASMIVAGRYDLRAMFGGLAMVLRLVGVAIGVQYGVTWAVVGILVGQIVGSCASGYAGHRLFAQHPAAEATGLRRDRAELMRFVFKSGIGTSLVSMRNTLSPLVLGVVSTATQVGYFRAAQAPITAFEALSAPVRLILLTEQTHDVERGRIAETYRSLRRYVVGATVVALALAPIAWVLMPWLVRVVLGTDFVPGDGGRPDLARGGLDPTRARLDEVVPGLDREAGPSDRCPRRRDRGPAAADRDPRLAVGRDRRQRSPFFWPRSPSLSPGPSSSPGFAVSIAARRSPMLKC